MSVTRNVLRGVLRSVTGSVIRAGVISRYFTFLDESASQYYSFEQDVVLTGIFDFSVFASLPSAGGYLLSDNSTDGTDRWSMENNGSVWVTIGGETVSSPAAVMAPFLGDNIYHIFRLTRDNAGLVTSYVDGTEVWSTVRSGVMAFNSVGAPRGAATSVPYWNNILANLNILGDGIQPIQLKLNENFGVTSIGVNSSPGTIGTYGNVTAQNISTDSPFFTKQSDGNWLGVELITQNVWENPSNAQSEWAFADNQWALTGSGVVSVLALLLTADQPETMRLSGNCVSLSGVLSGANSGSEALITSTGFYSFDISKAVSGSQLFKRSAGVVNATLDKPSLKQLLEVAT